MMNDALSWDQRTLKRACRPFSAACSSRRFFSSGDRLPAFSAAWIWSNTLLSSIAERRVDTLLSGEDVCVWTVSGHLRLAKHMILPLHVVQPAADPEKCLAGGQVVLRL